MSVSFLPSLDITTYASETQGLSLRALSYFCRVHADLNQQNIGYAPAYLRETAGLYETYFDVTCIESLDDIISIIDSGAAKVFVTLKQLESLRKAGVDADRIVKSVEPKCVASAQNSCATASHDLLLRDITDVDGVVLAVSKNKSAEDPLDNPSGQIFVSPKDPNQDAVFKLAKAGAIPIVPATQLTLDVEAHPNLISAPELLLVNARSDRQDRSISTIVTDERGTALGLVYSSKESVTESLKSGRGVYQSRNRGLWRKGDTSGDIQELVCLRLDCDMDALCFMVKQKGKGFCHLKQATCFGHYTGLSKLQETLKHRKKSAPEDSYTARLFTDPELLNAKIREEAHELCEATSKEEISWEAADLVYFALTKCIAAGVTLEDIELNLDVKSVKVRRRPGNAKPNFLVKRTDSGAQFAKGASNVDTTRANVALQSRAEGASNTTSKATSPDIKAATPVQVNDFVNGSVNGNVNGNVNDNANGNVNGDVNGKVNDDVNGDVDGEKAFPPLDEKRIQMTRYVTADMPAHVIQDALQRPSQRSGDKILGMVSPIIKDVRDRGDAALLEYTKRFEKVQNLTSPVLKAPYPKHLMELSQETIDAIDVAFENIRKFHTAQKETKPLFVETMPGVECSRFARPIERVGLYVPGGTAVLPSTAMMLGIPAMVAGCQKIVLATPPREDGSVTPSIVYVANKIGAESIVLAGGAQAVAALAYGTESVSKVDKILGPGNQFVTAGKMLVSNDTSAGVSIDMPAGPSEVLVVADATSNPAFVAADLLSQAEHGEDSQVVCIAVDMTSSQVSAIEDELHKQASALPRVDIVRGAIEHSVTLCVSSLQEGMDLANRYAPEHLILQVKDAEHASTLVQNAGSVFIGPWTPESVGDYSAGVNHALPTYGYAKMYSGVNLASYIKHITSSKCTMEGLRNLSSSVMELATVEELEAHKRAVSIRLDAMR